MSRDAESHNERQMRPPDAALGDEVAQRADCAASQASERSRVKGPNPSPAQSPRDAKSPRNFTTESLDLSAGSDVHAAAAPVAPAPAVRALARAPQRVPEPPSEHIDDPSELQPGMMFHHYQLIRPLGRGGMGAVYLARDTRLGRRVAMKFLARQDRAWAARFLSEARATARCEHDNIVDIYHADEAHGRSYMVLEYIEGVTLRNWMHQRWPYGAGQVGNADPLAQARPAPQSALDWAQDRVVVVSPTQAVEFMVPVVRALAHAHQLGLVHRDLKPENIMLTNEGTIKVLDFGVAKLLDMQPQALLTGESTHNSWAEQHRDHQCQTREGALLGTLPYMSPEQWRTEEIDGRSDIWAVGIMLWELCTGRHPLAPFTHQGLMQVGDPAVPMPSLVAKRGDLGALAETIDYCIVKNKVDRMPSAKALLAALEPLLPSRGTAAAAATEAELDNPYVGLAAFQERDAERFFGRDREITGLVNQLRNRCLVTVAGASGTGKSSFVRAGVIPALARSGQRWQWFILRPGRQPLAGLAGILDEIRGHTGQASKSGSRHESMAALRAEPGLLGTALRAHGHQQRAQILLFIDQFEELYTLGADRDSREAFVRCLEGVADDASSPLRVVLSVRSDFLDRVAEDRVGLSEITRSLWFLPAMGRSELSQALLLPLQTAGYHLEHQDRLVPTMLDALETTRAPLPLLQFTAARLWELRDPEQKRISQASYQQLGGVAGALAAHADTVLAGLSARKQGLARIVLTSLVTEERTRAIVSLDELRALAPKGADAAVEEVVQHLAAARLLLMETDIHKGGATVEISHESLIVRWPRLGQWLSEDQEENAFRARLRAAARTWDKHKRSTDLLWRGQAADEAQRWLERWRSCARGAARETGQAAGKSPGKSPGQAAGKSPGQSGDKVSGGKSLSGASTGVTDGPDLSGRDLDYLYAVVTLAAHKRRQQRRLRIGAFAAVSAIAVVFSVLTVYAGRQSNEATKQAALADEKAVLADEQAALRAAEAIQARNASRIASAREYQSEDSKDPTLVLALVRELESADKLPPRWRALARWAMYEGVAQVILTHQEIVYSASFSPDGTRIVTASGDKTARVWQVDGLMEGSGAPLVLRGHQDSVSSASFSPDGTRIVTTSWDKTARVWNADGSGASLVLQGHQDRVSSASFSPDGTRVVTASRDKTARVWQVDGSMEGSGAPLVLQGHQASVSSASFSPDGTRIVTASTDKTARVWQADGSMKSSGALLVLQGHRASVYSASFSPDGTRIVTASRDKTARVWQVDGSMASPGAPLVLQGHQDTVYSAVFSPDGTRIVTASFDQTARVWNADGSGVPRALQGHRDIVVSAVFSPDSTRIVTASFDKTVRVWKVDGSMEGSGAPFVLQGHQDIVFSAVFSPDGTRIVTASFDETARVWNAAGSGAPVVLQGHQGSVTSASFSPDGTRILTASADRTARVWNAAGSGTPLVLQGHQDSLYSASFSPDGTRIVTASFDKTARVWNADGSGVPFVLRGHQDRLSSAVFSPDGMRIVTASSDKTVRVWSADRATAGFGTGFGVTPLVLQGHSAAIATGARAGGRESFSPDGARFVTISEDKTVRVWNTDGTGEPLILRMPDLDAESVAFSPDGTRIATTSHRQRIGASGEMRNVAKVWPIIERFRGLDDPRLWRATSYCPPVELRMELLGVSADRAARDLARCERRVAEARTHQTNAQL